ncbi:hypothetical protein LTR37_006037 [Vermiconidia calcicola]|uniref:Uncharacterized protein n=1 Tax=Vermiconidia calcicola TaxID=1690605 RepID=A0ACC3NK62_9PEZI|nr:hypothetical protein LTR37_006037 [Vermiconidia calcicola]
MEAREGSSAAASNGSTGAYTLRDLISEIPLAADGDEQARITCVDAWNGNLYIGTSAGQVLHYVSIPPDPSDESGQASYIFATKLEPPFTTRQEGDDEGIKQILLLGDAGKACVLCNGTLTLYTLPELSPAYGGKINQVGCTWIGGLDANLIGVESDSASGTVVVLCLKQRLRLIRVGREARKLRDIELGGVSAIQRRGDLACVADGNAYSLLDVVNHRKNELFQVSSLSAAEPEKPLPELPRSPSHGPSRSLSSASPVRQSRGHERNVSLGGELVDNSRLRPGSSSPWPARGTSRQGGSPAEPSSREQSPAKADHASPRASMEAVPQSQLAPPARPLPANILTPSPTEFLLTTGTQMDEPGIGMIVNLDGDPSRGPLEFSSYPECLVLDGSGGSDALPGSEGYVLALVQKKGGDNVRSAIEIQRWDDDQSEQQPSKEWLMLNSLSGSPDGEDSTSHCGLRTATSEVELSLPEITTSLRLRRLALRPETQSTDTDAQREGEEDKFAARFAQIQARVLLYTRNRVQWVTKNPLITRLDSELELAIQGSSSSDGLTIDVSAVQHVINSIRGQDARDELEFRTLEYIRQRASILLFGNLLLQTVAGTIAYESGKRLAEEVLVAGELDPRIVLSLVPPLNNEVHEGKQGIWIPQGLRDTVTMLKSSFELDKLVQDPHGAYGDNLLTIVKRYLLGWRKKKGFGSIADEEQVFKSVDAALLHILLMLDQNSPRGPATAGSVRAELNVVVDRGVDCFDRAVELFEQFDRLYMLSRLYQSRTMIAQVLATWRRILEGEKDVGGELIEGEQDLRRYLTKIRDPGLVQEYGAWLANRNPKLGVQIFADDSSRVKFEPSQAVTILKERAPGAVKDYLEHLVFGKNNAQYVNDLIAFYLDIVLAELQNSNEVKASLIESYETYRALHPPKPTYRQFIEDNSVNAEWQRSRLRLLQLIGGSHGAASKYDVHALRERLSPHSDELVPEMIILNGREGKHEEALRLLTHGLADYDTAIRYCLLGGSSIFHPGSGLAPEHPLPSKEEQGKLFEHLLHEFFRIEDLGERLERTAELLERFGGWFDIAQVLDLIPDSWSVELVSGFLVHALRRMVRERNETVVVKALASAQNLKRSVEFVEKTESIGPTVVTAEVEAV